MRIASGMLLLSVFVQLFSSSAANAASFQFEQTGFVEGARLVGNFTGSDTNGDMLLTVDTLPGSPNADGTPFIVLNELSAFTVMFTGNSLVAAFELGLPDILTAQFGVPCCGSGRSFEFYFDLLDINHLEFVAMSSSKIALILKDDPFGNFSGVGEQCTFVSGSGGCTLQSSGPYSPSVGTVPIPAALVLLISALGPLSVSFRRYPRQSMQSR